MSMLAEGRKKVKYSINPRGATWSNDEDKFGQKLMEKFGWQKGKGLGVNEDGRVEHVKASGKINTKGLGFKRTDSNNWICHQDDFNSLLSELNANHGRTDQDDTEKVISLEEKSKAAKKRVHYHKHAKGKDLSQRSSEDLDCIFGRKKSRQSQVKEPSPDVQDKNVATPTEETTHGIQTIQSNQSVQEYFAMKMAKLKFKKNSDGQQSCLSDALPKEETEPDRCAEGLVSNETSAADSEAVGGDEENMEEKSKKKKKKKSKEKEREKEDKDDRYCSTLRTDEKGKADRNDDDDDDDDNSGENCDENLSKKTKKSKRKKRSKECIDDEVEETSQNLVKDAEMATGEINSISKSSKKKLDKKNKVKISPSDSNVVEGSKSLENPAFFEKDPQDSTNTDLVDMDSRISKKAMSSIDKEAAIVENETMSKPKKNKKKRKKNVIEENDVDKSVTFDMENSNSNNGNVDDNNDEEASPPKKKKKSKKSKSEESLDTQTADGSIGDETNVHVKEIDSAEAKTSSVTNSPQVPKSKYDVKRSMDAINTATKKFQKVGANIDTICGYGYTKQ